MSQTPEEPRELTPVQMFWDGRAGIRDFGPRVLPADAPDPVEQPVPKDESALASVASSGSPLMNQLSELATTAQHARTPLTPEKLEDVVTESGKLSESTEQSSSEETSPSTESSSQSSSSEDQTKSGNPVPPAPVLPPLPSAPIQTK